MSLDEMALELAQGPAKKWLQERRAELMVQRNDAIQRAERERVAVCDEVNARYREALTRVSVGAIRRALDDIEAQANGETARSDS